MHSADEEGGLEDIVAALRAAQPTNAAPPPLQGGHEAGGGDDMHGGHSGTASAGRAPAADVASVRRQRLRAPQGSCQAALAALKVQYAWALPGDAQQTFLHNSQLARLYDS